MLKSIALKNAKKNKPPIWDIEDLVQYLSSYSVDTGNIYQVSRHTAILLLLCSGRRIHDLTLLRVDPEHCVKTQNSITFWPEFGPKTDNSEHRQSGWKLVCNNNNSQLDPIFWINTMISLLSCRREAVNSFKLFMTIRGAPKPASRTVISGWIKHLFKDARIQFSPGSVRSAVASKNWLNYPLDEVLARGNWRSSNTFETFYRREIRSSNETGNNMLSRLFTPVH
ncbi:hypothetical protein ACJJTC_009564 [Scirpophaga incertulas]